MLWWEERAAKTECLCLMLMLEQVASESLFHLHPSDSSYGGEEEVGGSRWQLVSLCHSSLFSLLCLCINSKVLILSELGASTLITTQLQTLRGRTVDRWRWQQTRSQTLHLFKHSATNTNYHHQRRASYIPDFASLTTICSACMRLVCIPSITGFITFASF